MTRVVVGSLSPVYSLAKHTALFGLFITLVLINICWLRTLFFFLRPSLVTGPILSVQQT